MENNISNNEENNKILEVNTKRQREDNIKFEEFKIVKEESYFIKILKEECFVDKTRFIEKLEKKKKNSFICYRPRRFGKTVTLSMLKEFYDIKSKNDDTFKDLYINNYKTNLRNSFLILEFNFSGLNIKSLEKFEVDLNIYINDKLESFIKKYNYIFKEFAFKNEDAIRNLENLVDYIKADYKLFILVDEYDTSINSCLNSNSEEEIKNLNQ
jgi:hypothetical protein